MKYTAEEVRDYADACRRRAPGLVIADMLTELAERIEADEMAADYPECSGDPASCPENEGFGCCKAHAEAITLHPPAQAAQGEASLGRCKACGRATRAVCDGLDGNGMGCTNAPSIDLAAVREVIAHLRSFRSNTPPTWAHLDDAANKLEAALQELKP